MSDQLLISTLQISDDFAPIIVAFAFKIDSKAKFYVLYPKIWLSIAQLVRNYGVKHM